MARGLMCIRESYVESLCGGRSLLVGTGCNCIPQLIDHYQVDVVVALFEDWECDEDIIDYAKQNTRLYRYPVQDFTVQPLLNIIRAVETIALHVRRGDAVLVACYGGCGRTGTVISLYNIVYRCMGYEEAISHYTRLRGCGPESPDQQALLYKAAELASNYGCCDVSCGDGGSCSTDYEPARVLMSLMEYAEG